MFGKSAFKKEERSLQMENIPSVPEVFLFSLRKCSWYRQRKQYWISYVTERRECSKRWMFPADVWAILQNSLTPITAWVLGELNQCEIFLPWFFQLKLRVKAHWLSLPSGKCSDLWSEDSNYSVLSQKPHVSVQLFMGLLFILKDMFLFPSKLEWLWSIAECRMER